MSDFLFCSVTDGTPEEKLPANRGKSQFYSVEYLCLPSIHPSKDIVEV